MCSEKCDYMADNIHLEIYGESVMGIYIPFRKPSFLYKLSALHFCHVPWVLHFHLTVVRKYSDPKFEFTPHKFFTIALISWQWLVVVAWLLQKEISLRFLLVWYVSCLSHKASSDSIIHCLFLHSIYFQCRWYFFTCVFFFQAILKFYWYERK